MQTHFRRRTHPMAFVFIVACSMLAPVVAWSITTIYTASLGTLPQAQGWTIYEDIAPPSTYPLSVGPSGLHLNTTGFGINIPPNVGGGVWWSRSGLGIDFAQDFAVEASVKVISAPNHSINTVAGWPRPGYQIGVVDVSGRAFWIGLGTTEVFLSNTFYGQYDQPNTVHTPFVTTDRQHVYRIEKDGAGAALRIDGVLVLQLPAVGPVESSEGVHFGDGTYWANSDTYTAWVKYETPAITPVITTPAYPSRLWVSPLGNPAERVSIGFESSLAGTLTLELFDVAGRRVSRAEQSVSIGQTGRFDLSRALPAGIYYYRATLTAMNDNIVSTGRVAIVR